jgi:RING-variant domain
MNRLSKGYAQGLSSHSSMQNSSEIFKKSEVFEVSSIDKNEDFEEVSKDNIIKEIANLMCRFCGRSTSEKLITVCRCNLDFSAHISCLKSLTESKCKKCGSKWLQKPSTPEILIADPSSKSSPLSIINESSGEIRMRNMIKAASKKPVCRICKEDKETEENKIIYPCQCHTVNASLAWAHRDCILLYIIKRQKDDCEVCKSKYSFIPSYEKIWVCQEQDYFYEFVGDLLKLFVSIGTLIGLIVFLSSTKDIYGNYLYEYIWSILLICVLGVLLALVSLLLLRIIMQKSTRKVINSLQVLCQKQEIAKMSIKSHECFNEYLDLLREKGLIDSIEPSKDASDKFDDKNLQPRVVLEMDTNGENIESEWLREHSSLKVISSISIESSENFKDEDIREHSEVN